MWRRLLFFGLLCLSACAGPVPERQEDVKSLRILAIRAEPPDVRNGDTVQLTALVANPSGRPLSWQWYACRSKSLSSTGCAHRIDAIQLGNSPQQSYQVPKDYLPKDASLVDQFRGVYLPISLVVTAGQERAEAIKRVVVSLFPTNSNPLFTGIHLSPQGQNTALPEPWQYKAGATYQLTPRITPNSTQTYFTLSPDGKLQNTQEVLFLSWYITAGTLRGGRQSQGGQPEKQWVAPTQEENPQAATIYVIMRDGRGGVDWLTRTLQPEP